MSNGTLEEKFESTSINTTNGTSSEKLELVLGSISWGNFPNLSGRPSPFSTVESITPIIDSFQAHGHSKIDTARIYGAGSSEPLLTQAEWQTRGLGIETKLYPTKSIPLSPWDVPYNFGPEDLRAGLNASLSALKASKIDTFYLHAPDRTIPYEVTLREINKLHQEGLFARWGLTNYPSWEVALMQELCIKHGWVRPAVFQSVYNALLRTVEDELIPCLRHYGMAFEAAQPLASGLLTCRYRRDMPDSAFEPGSRFDPSHFIGRHIRDRYWYDAYFDALEIIEPAAKRNKLGTVECALRWLAHHSVLDKGFGDAIVLGTSSVQQLEEQLEALDKGPLPEDVVEAFEKAWVKAKKQPGKYHN
jgi:aflatoxin B1 aldehyde reductase